MLHLLLVPNNNLENYRQGKCKKNEPSTSISTTPPNSTALLLWTHMENPARGPGGIPLFFTYEDEREGK